THWVPRLCLTASMCASWSSKIDWESWSRRPISVDLPSSTLPSVANRSGASRDTSEVADTLAVFHPRFGDAVIGPGRTALGDPGDGGLGDDVLDGERRRLDRGRAGGVADRAEPHRRLERCLAVEHPHVAVDGHQHPVTPEDVALVGVVQRRQVDL